PVKVRHQPNHHARTVHGDDFTYRFAVVLLVRRIGRKKPVDQRHQQCANGKDREYQAPAVRAVQDPGNQESDGHHADGDSDIAHSKDAEGCTLLRFGVPGRYMSVADHEARASESEQRPQNQKGVVALGEGPGKQDNREGQKQKRENRPAAELVGPDAERDADGGREKGLHRSEDEHLGGAETVPLDQKGGERGKHSPNRKTERKRQERYPQNPGVARRIGHHINLDNWIFHGFSYKKIYLFAGYFNCRLTALAPTDKAPLSPSHRDGRATPARILRGAASANECLT